MNNEDYISCIGKHMQRKTRDLIDNLIFENKQLKERIDKTIELLILKQNSFDSIINVADVIEILKGDNNE